MPKISHVAFFEALGSLEDNSEAARRVVAGLVVLRLVDNVCSREQTHQWNRGVLRPVAEAVSLLRDPDRAKRDLFSILETIENSDGRPDKATLAELLIAYGKTLDLESSWNLAADALQTAAEVAPAFAPGIAADANTLLGAVARRAGDWELSTASYARAVNIAGTAGDLRRALKAEVGFANNYFARGELPAADEMLDGVLAEARANRYDDVASMALHTSGSVAHQRGQYVRAVELAYDALKLAPDDSTRDVILSDIASSFAEMGMSDAARDALLIASAISQSPAVRSLAMVNLLELAGRDGMVEAFDRYCADVAAMPLEARHRAYYLLYRGKGEVQLGRLDTAGQTLEEAKRFAEANQMQQVLCEAETAIAALEATKAGTSSVPVETIIPITESSRRIARELTQMRELALADL